MTLVGAGPQLARFSYLVSLTLAIGACGDGHAASDAGGRDAASFEVGGPGDGAIDQPPSLPRDTSCGGTAQVSGTAPQQSSATTAPFSASYVYAFEQGGDCSARLHVVLADSGDTSGTSLTFEVGPVGATSSFVGASTTTISFQTGSFSASVAGQADITGYVAPGAGDGALGSVAGTIDVQMSGVSISGTFSTPLCSDRICI
jgi:hypothetical protein